MNEKEASALILSKIKNRYRKEIEESNKSGHCPSESYMTDADKFFSWETITDISEIVETDYYGQISSISTYVWAKTYSGEKSYHRFKDETAFELLITY